MECDKHFIQTLLYQNPWRLPFAWKNCSESLRVLRAAAWEEEKQRGPKQMVVKVLDIPEHIIQRSTPPTYQNVMEGLKLHHTLLKKEVPQCETHTTQNGRFPLLGKQFLVMFNQCVRRHNSVEMGFPCLLCKRRLFGYEFYAHLFSWEHVKGFLDCFHPGSLSSNTDTETILDLAKQAARIHPICNVQEIKLDKPIREPCIYSIVISILASAKRRHGGGKLEPCTKPLKKLFPSKTLKEGDKALVRDNSQTPRWMMEGSDSKTSQTSSDNPENTPKNTSAEPGSGKKNSEGAHKETLTPSDTQSEKSTDVFSKTCPDEVKKTGVESCQWIKQEKRDEIMEEVKKADVETSQWIKQEKMDEIMEKVKEITVELKEIKEENIEVSTWEITERCHNTDNGDRAETGEGCKDVRTPLQTCMNKKNERKRPNCMSEKSQESECSADDVGREIKDKRLKLSSPCEEPQTLSSSGQKLVTTIVQTEGGKRSHKTTNDKVSSNENQQAVKLWQYIQKNNREPLVGLSALLECVCGHHDPIYLCKCCSLKLPETNIINHVSGLDHQRMYLLGTQKIQPPTGKHQTKLMRCLAASFEQDKGYGEAQVIELDEDVFERISKQSFYSAMQTIKSLQAQQDNRRELSSAPALPAAQPEPASVTVHAKLEIHSWMDDIQVMDVDIDAENSGTKPSSVTRPMSVKTEHTQDASSPHVSKSGTNAASLHPDSTGNNSENKITPSTIMEQWKKLTSNLPESTTAITKCTPDYTKSVHKLTATASSCTRATTTSGETTYKCRAANLGATATATKPTATTVCTASSSQYTAASSTRIGSTSTSNMSVSGMASTTKSTTSTKPMESIPGATTKTTATSCKTTHVPTHSETASKFKVTPQTTVPNAVAATATQTSTTDPSQAFTKKIKGSNRPPRLGLDEVITVTSGHKKKFFCQLCSVMLKESCHLSSRSHVYQCVKKKYSGFIPDMLESPNNWAMVVANLAELEKKCGNRRHQIIEVTDDVYNELGGLDAKTAIGRLNMMLNQAPLPSTDDTRSLRPKPASSSPCEASSSSDVIDTPQDETPELFTNNRPQQENTCIPVQEKPGRADPCAANSASAGTSAETPHTHQGTLENRWQQERSDPEMRDTGTTFPVISSSPDPVSLAPVNTEQQDKSRPRLKAERAPTPEHEQHSASWVLPSVSVSEINQSQSYFSTWHTDTEPIIGLDNVWECRGIFGSLFFLCESCKQTLSVHHIFQHLVSTDHMLNHMWKCYPQFMLQFWPLKDLDQEKKFSLLKDVVVKLSKRDFFYKRVLLGPELFERVRTAPFSEAFEIVTRIKKEEEQRVVCLPVSTCDNCPPTRKRPTNPQLEDPLPVKRTRSSLTLPHQPSSEPALQYSVNPPATFIPVSGDERGAGPGCDEERTSTMNAPGNADVATSCDNTSESGVEGKWASKFVQTEVKMEETASQWNSQCAWLKASVKNIPLSVESMFSPAPCVDLKNDNQHNPKVLFVSSSSPEGHSPGGNILSSATVRTSLPSVSTAHPDELLRQTSADAQNMFINVSKLQPHLSCGPANFTTGHVSQPQSNTTTDTAGGQLPIKPIITARSKCINQHLRGGYNRPDLTEVKVEIQDTPSLFTDQTARPSMTSAAPGGYGQYSQKAHLIKGLPVAENFAFCTAPENPSVYPHAFTISPNLGRLSLDMQQQQRSSLTSATLAAGVGNVTNDAVNLGAVPFTILANNSQRLADLSACSTSGVVPAQSSNDIIPRYFYQVYNRPPAFQSPPPSQQ